MKMKVFIDRYYDAADAFNNWAKGKALQKDVLIQTHQFTFTEGGRTDPYLLIVVIHPEDEHWDKTEPHIEAPLHKDPIPHIKAEEIKVIQ